MSLNHREESPRPRPMWLEEAVEAWRHQHRGCPDDATLVAYWQGACSRRQQCTLWWHIHRCALCRADLTTLREAFAEHSHNVQAQRWGAVIAEGWQEWRVRWRYALPLAMVMVVGTVFLFRHMQPEEHTWRGGGVRQIIHAPHPAMRLAEILAACQDAGYVCTRPDRAAQVVDIRTPEVADERFTQFLDRFGIHLRSEPTLHVEIKAEAAP